MDEQGQTTGRLKSFSRRFTLVVSNVVKLSGVFIALKAIGHQPIDPFELALSAFMMSGAQASEKAVMRLLNNFLGREEAPPDKEHKS